MAPTDYATMPAGRELDALVAEHVIGWTGIARAISADGTDGVDQMGRPLALIGRLNGAIHTVPPFSTDIAAAWTVVRHMRASRGCMLNLNVYVNTAEARFITSEVRADIPGFLNSDWQGADSEELAICRAALAVVVR